MGVRTEHVWVRIGTMWQALVNAVEKPSGRIKRRKFLDLLEDLMTY
jgi:hypothetical protein